MQPTVDTDSRKTETHPGQDGPRMAVDLGSNIGTRRWWAGAAGLVGLVAAAAAALIAIGPPQLSHVPQPSDHFVAQSSKITPADGGSLASEGGAPLAAAATPGISYEIAGWDDLSAPAAAPAAPEPVRAAFRMERGDTLIGLLLKAGVTSRAAHEAVSTMAKLYNPRKLRAGQTVWTEILPPAADGSENELVKFEFEAGFAERIIVSADEAQGGFLAERAKIDAERNLVAVEASIDDSLYLTAERNGVPAAVIVNLIRILSYSIDFQRDIWPGDRFSVMFERFTTEEGDVKLGHILYGELNTRRKPIALYRFKAASDDRADYYGPDGKSVRRLLMRTPIDGARLSSRFGKRRHPVLGYTRMHSGLDFAAPTGTPIMAAGDATVEFIGRNGGYGNMIRLRHNGTFKTAYAHMSRFKKGLKKGARVYQGETIGYVGSTGRSTGPHLHYEVFRNGGRVNPLSLELPTGKELDGEELAAFERARAEIDNTLHAKLPPRTLIAGEPSPRNSGASAPSLD